MTTLLVDTHVLHWWTSGWRLVTKDRALQDHPHPRSITIW